MFLRTSPEVRVERVAKAKVETALTPFEDQLFMLHKEYFRGLLGQHVERVKQSLTEPEYPFEMRYPFALGKIATRAFAATEKARRRHELDPMLVAREIGVELSGRSEEKRLCVSDSVFEGAGYLVRQELAGLSYAQLFTAAVKTAGGIIKPSQRVMIAPNRQTAAELFTDNFDQNRAMGDVAFDVSTNDPVGMLRMTLGQISNSLLDREAFAFDSAMAELKDRTMPTSRVS